jgi:stage III sporulation protein AG
MNMTDKKDGQEKDKDKGKKNKKSITNLVIMLLVGVLLLVVSAYIARIRGDEGPESIYDDFALDLHKGSAASFGEEALCAYLSRQMEEILSQIAGAGQVRVMLTMGTTAGIYAQNSQTSHSATTETDGEGGERNIDVESSSHSYVMMRQSDGSERPLRIQELRPETLGVIIVAQGAGDAAVRDALVRAAHTVLGIGAHRVQVFQMEVK